jgi:hypothetical protein
LSWSWSYGSWINNSLCNQCLSPEFESRSWRYVLDISIPGRFGFGSVSWCLTTISTITQLYRGGQFYWWEKPGIPEENHRPAAGHSQALSHIDVSIYQVHIAMNGIRTLVIGTDCSIIPHLFYSIVSAAWLRLPKFLRNIYFLSIFPVSFQLKPAYFTLY